MTATGTRDVLLLTVSGDVHLKSERTQRRLRRVLRSNLEAAVVAAAPAAVIRAAPRGRIIVEAPDAQRAAAADAAARVFGICRVVEARHVPDGSFDAVVTAATEWGRPLVAGRRFAVRVRRRGEHDWGSVDAERAIGSALFADSAGVDLTHPDVEVGVEVWDGDTYLLGTEHPGPDGMPLNTQDRLLSLLSGGFDSPVAAWLMQRKGCPVDYVHFMMDCSQSDHALAVAYGMWAEWGRGDDPVAWVVDFTEIKESLLGDVDSAHRQVVLKQLMFAAADELADRLGIAALVTGDSVGQVSTQTVSNLVEIDRVCHRTVLRPLAGLTKQEILAWSRRTGTHDLSARAKEVCNLATGPVHVAARRRQLERVVAGLPDDLVSRALAARRAIRLADWSPGVELVPVVDELPAGAQRVTSGQVPAGDGPVAVSGFDAARWASQLVRAGHDAVIIEPPLRRSIQLAG